MLEALPQGRPPRFVGPYRLLARLGAGGMGEVHLACRTDAPTADPHRMVAVKTVREDLEVDGDFRTRFRREIAAARTVDGPGVARLVDAGPDAPSPWLATEYVPGPSLAEAVVRTGPLPAGAVRALGAALARALAAVHGVQVLHRDLKPANVLLGAAGPKLIDFGIAQAFEATALTSTGLVVGSPGFMAPEHLVGSRAVVPASDVFCLGAVLAFAASGRGPFQDDEMAAVIYRISRAEAELDGVPGELRPVLERCLRLDPAERPPAAELAELLGGSGGAPEPFPWPGGVLSLVAESREAARAVGEAAASGTGVADLPTLGPVVPYSPTAVPDRPVAPAAALAGRPRRWGALAAGAVAVAVLATAGTVLLNRTDEQGGGPGTPDGPSAGATAAPAPAPVPASLSRVVLPYGGAGRAGDFGAAGTDRASRPAGWSPWRAEVEPGGGACALSPEVLVCPGDGGAVTALGAADGKERWKVPGRGEGLRSAPQYPAVVGDTAYVTGPDGVVAYGLADGKERRRLPGPGSDWAVKGTDLRDGVLYSTYVNMRDERTGLVTAVRLRDGKELWRSPLDGLPEQPVAGAGRVFVPVGTEPVALDARTGKVAARGAEYCGGFVVREKQEESGTVLCSARQDGAVGVLDARTLRTVRTLGSGVVAGPAVNAAGLVALVDAEGTLFAYDLESGRERWRVAGVSADRVHLAGDRVVTTDEDEVRTYPAAGPFLSTGGEQGAVYRLSLPTGFASEVAGEPLVAGGAAFLPLPGGLVVSGYLP